MYDNLWAIQNYRERGLHFFWGGFPKDKRVIDDTCLSQWYNLPFKSEDGLITYRTAEHYMMYQKAKLFNGTGNMEIAKSILESYSPKEAKRLGRSVNNFKNDVWERERLDIVYKGNLLKFSQNEKIKEYLINTGNKILVESSPYDKIWGIGMHESERGVTDPFNWQGLNLLGYQLMKVRDALK